MTKNEAIVECQRYLAYLDAERKRSFEFQRLATLARSGAVEEANHAARILDASPVVYDAGQLEHAIKRLLKEVM